MNTVIKKIHPIVLTTVIFAVAWIVFVGVSHQVQAVDVLPDEVCTSSTGEQVSVCKDKVTVSSNPFLGNGGLVTRGIQLFAFVIGVTAVVMMFIAAYQFMSTGGDSAKAATARKTVIYAIAGLVIALLSQAIVSFILNKV